jgi:DNA modification methylase
MTEQAKTKKKPTDVTVGRAKGRPMLSWVGKKPLGRVTAFPAQHIERFSAEDAAHPLPPSSADWSKWPKDLPQGGLLYHGDNKEVLAHLLANGFRGQVKLIYIDPPFDSAADYVRKVQLRGPKGALKVEGEEYALGEQVQYTDIWSNDNYLQFMYERLLMLKELLSDDGSILLHCNSKKGFLLRCLLDEVFSSDSYRNEITWHYVKYQMGQIGQFVDNTDRLLWYSKGQTWTYNLQAEKLENPKFLLAKGWDKDKGVIVNLRNEAGKTFKIQIDEEKVDDFWSSLPVDCVPALDEAGQKIVIDKVHVDDAWLMPFIAAPSHERTGYPTQKPIIVLERIVKALSNPGDLVLDCFVGSGTSVVAAQKLGRRWIGCDINKGAIQTAAKRLQGLLIEQAAMHIGSAQGELVAISEVATLPSQLGFTTWRVNDYDLHIQHNEAVELACEHLGITRTRTDPYFDGTRGKMLVKIIPLNHPLTPLDLEALRTELKNRPEEERDLLVVSLGQEHKAREWVEHYNHNRPINKIHLIELRTDRKAGGFIKHEPMSVQASVQREGDKLIVTIADVVSPSIIARLDLQEGIFRAQIPDWRAVVDCVLIDSDHDGAVFNVTLADVPERKQDFVAGRYELAAPPVGSVVAVKVIDMLGEERVISLTA